MHRIREEEGGREGGGGGAEGAVLMRLKCADVLPWNFTTHYNMPVKAGSMLCPGAYHIASGVCTGL